MEVPQLPLVQFLAVIDMPVVFVTTGACVGPDSAENVKVPHAFLDIVVDKCQMVETVLKLWSLRSWCCPSVSVHGRLSSGNGFSDVMGYEQFWRR